VETASDVPVAVPACDPVEIPASDVEPEVPEPEYEDDALESDEELPEGELITAVDPSCVPPDEGDIGSIQVRRLSSVSGLSAPHRTRARYLACQAALLTIRRAPDIHYTQEMVRRWEGIAKGLKAYKAEFPRYADCSSIATWWLWQGLDHYGVRDVVNDTNWKSGYTGTMLRHGKQVVQSGNWLQGDLFIYGNGWPGSHVAMYLGGGFVASHGSEPGPFKVRWNYRSDLMQVRRYV
jgi:hypothetical protein